MQKIISHPSKKPCEQAFIDILNQLIIGLDDTFNIVQINQKTKSLFNWTDENSLKHNFFELCFEHNTKPPFDLEQLTLFSKQGGKSECTRQLVNDSLHIEWQLFSNDTISHNNHPVAIWMIGTDISESMAKTEFISHMSHDLRAPMVGIMPIVQHLMQHESDTNKHQLLECVYKSSKTLLTLINYIMDVTNLRTGEVRKNITSFSAAELIQEASDFIAPAARLKHLEINLEIAHNVPDRWQTDRHKLFRVLINLMSNAVRFTQQGSIQVTVMLKHNTSPHSIEINVIDTGMGIPEDKHDVIFSHLCYLSDSHDGRLESCGIGLYEAKRFAADLGGSISIQSKMGVGSTFTVRFALDDLVAP